MNAAQLSLPRAAGDARDALVLAIDLGSGGPKVGYVTLTGEPVWWEYHRGDVLHGAATQEADVWWQTIVALAQQGIAEGVDGSRVVGVAITGQYASTVPVDEAGNPVAECLMWSDDRGAEHSATRFGGPILGYKVRVAAAWLRRSGGVPSPTGCDPIAHMLHLKHDRPEVMARARWFLEPVDFLAMRFTGRAHASLMSMTAAWLTDNRAPATPSYDPVLVKLAGVDPTKLPPLVEAATMIGTVQPDVAELIGIPASAQVITPVPDLHNTTIASGCVEELRPHMSLGTSSWVSCPLPAKKTDAIRQMAAIPGVGIGGTYQLINNQDNAGRCLEWFRSAAAPELSYDDLAALAATSPPGANKVIFTPWLSGERSPVDDRAARGGFHNLSLDTSRADLTRAVMEGVAYNMRWLIEASEHFAKARFDPIRVLGGCARIDLWCQIVADVSNRTLERVADPLIGGLRGGGLYFGLASGAVQVDEVYDLVPVDRTFRPDPATRATYDRLFAEFPGLHSRHKKMFARLNG